MKEAKLKCAVLYGMGIGMGAISIYGCYPMGIAYFAAMTMATSGWYLIFPMILFGMVLVAPMIEVAKYGVAMILFVMLTGMVEGQKGVCSKGTMTFLCAASLLAMNVTRYFLTFGSRTSLYMGIAESVFAGSVTVILYQIIQWFLNEKEPDKEKQILVGAPGREKLKESAEVLEKLSACFETMPNKKDVLTKQDMEEMFSELSGEFCHSCEKCKECWQKHYHDTYTNTYNLFQEIETHGEIISQENQAALAGQCIHYKNLVWEIKRIFEKTKSNLLWYNRVIENRTAVAVQLNEMAKMIVNVAEDIYEAEDVTENIGDSIKKKLKNNHIIVKKITAVEKKGRQELYITMKTDWKRCISVREIAGYISEVCKKRMVADKNSKMLLYSEDSTIRFVEDTNYKVLYGVSRTAKAGEQVSGDNFSFYFHENGQMTASLSDGMGTGIRACKESELVIELLERFLEAGFCKETALRMMNSTMVMNSQNGQYSTIDMAEVDLHTGICEFVKLGASYTFIKRENIVECIQIESLPLGMFHQDEFECITKKLYDGDYVIMVSDGVLTPIPDDLQIPMIEEIIAQTDCVNPKEMANVIMEKMLSECMFEPMDDMTVLVFGVWKK